MHLSYSFGSFCILATDGSSGELLLLHQPSLYIYVFIKWFTRIEENIVIILLS
jgi:hypothetical protein